MDINTLLQQLETSLFNFFSTSLVGFVVLILIVNNLMNRSKSTLIGAWLTNIMGVFFHEAAHAIVSLVLFAKPKRFSIIPKKMETKNGKAYVLGHVIFSNTKWYNAFPSAMAPLLLLFIAVFVENHFWDYFEKNFYSFLIYTYLLIVFIVNAIPSSQDFKVAFSNIIGVIFWVGIICFLPYLSQYILK